MMFLIRLEEPDQKGQCLSAKYEEHKFVLAQFLEGFFTDPDFLDLIWIFGQSRPGLRKKISIQIQKKPRSETLN